MIDPTGRSRWRQLEAELRPFIARRLWSAADVDDVLQDVFVRLHGGLSELRDDERFGPWVYRVARSAIVDHQRRSSKHHVPPEGFEPKDEAGVDDDDEAVEQALASYVAHFVAMLPSPYREALTLTEFEGLTQKEAAKMLGLSLSGMKSRVQRGRVQLRKAFEGCCHIECDVRGRVISCQPRLEAGFSSGCSCDAVSPGRDTKSIAGPQTRP